MTETERGKRRRYIEKAYDTLNFKVRKGGAAAIKKAAAEAGMSQRQFVIGALNAQMSEKIR